MSSAKPLQVVQFTDTHFFASPQDRLMGVDTAQSFEQVKNLAAQKHGDPDFYLLTGDLSQDETTESYQRFARAVSSFKSPAYYLPGNHDVPSPMQKAFTSTGAPFRADRSFVAGAWQVILLDTHVDGHVGGRLSDSELDHLQSSLSHGSPRHALVVLHHHPLPSGSRWLDGICLENRDQFLSIIDKHEHVRAVLFGHIHQEFAEIRNGVHYLATPSTCVQFKPRTEDFAVDITPPGYRLLELGTGGMVRSQVVRVDTIPPGLDVESAGY
jgi:Icc protein